ncbi:C-reactive protein [Lingula anatina]|uniref:C-reactive protein n=1 Tax=Lingula anatina TaxID=7574 RepID=A0A1S3HYD1_LINAN|nr:C-reactive protein [Lingula anatina]|eukprot:XP_013391035.1 C-reactive protein [Lingula anatina]
MALCLVLGLVLAGLASGQDSQFAGWSQTDLDAYCIRLTEVDLIRNQLETTMAELTTYRNKYQKAAAIVRQRSSYRFPRPQSTSGRLLFRAKHDTPLTSLTACAWMKTDFKCAPNCHLLTVFSYAHKANFNGFIFAFDGSSFQMHVESQVTVFGRGKVSGFLDNQWHHHCFSWSNAAGSWRYVRDGALVANGTDPRTKGRIISAGGIWSVGQEQDSVGGGFETTQAFVGDITQVHVWDTDKVQPAEVAKCGSDLKGNIISWGQDPLEENNLASYPNIDPSCAKASCKDN